MVAVRQFITEVIIRDKTKEGAASAQGSFAKLSASAQGAARAVDDVARVQANARGAFDRLTRSIDPAIKAHQDYIRNLNVIKRAQEQGVASAREAARAQSMLTQRYNESARAAQQAGKSTQQLHGVVGSLRGAFAGLAGVMSANSVLQAAGTYQQLEGRLRNVTSSTAELKTVQQDLFNVANNSRASFEAVVTLYARMSSSAKALGTSQQELIELTETVSKAFQVSGASAAEAQSATIQLAQGLSAGALRGAEYMSVAEGGSRIITALADALNKTKGELKGMADSGQLTADVVIPALLSQSEKLREEFEKLPVTASGIGTVFQNEFQKFSAALDQNAGLTKELTRVFENLRATMRDDDFIASVAGALKGFVSAAGAAADMVIMLGRAFELAGPLVGTLTGALLGAPFGPVGIAIGVVVGALGDLARAFPETTKEVQAFAVELGKMLGLLERSPDEMIAGIDRQLKQFREAQENAAPLRSLFGDTFDYSGDIADLERARKEIEDRRKSAYVGKVLGQIEAPANAAKEETDAANRLNEALKNLTGTRHGAEQAAERAAEADRQRTLAYEHEAQVLKLMIAGRDAEIPLLEAEWKITDQIADAKQRESSETLKLIERDRKRASDLGKLSKELMAARLAEDALMQARVSAAVAAGNLHEAEMLERIGALRAQNRDLQEDEARAMAETASATERQAAATDRIRQDLLQNSQESIQRQEAPWRNLISNVNSLWDDFWQNFAKKGFGAVEDLGAAFTDLWDQLQADLLSALFDPIREGITGAIQGVGQSGGFNLSSIFSSLFGSGGGGGLRGAAGATVYAGIGSPGYLDPVTGQPPGGGSGLNLGGGGSGIFDQIGDWLGIGTETMDQLVQGAGLGSLGGLLSDLLGLGSGNWISDVGSAIGGAIGNVILPGIGGIIGGFLGSALGGLFKQEPSNYAAGGFLDAQGNVIGSIGGAKATEETIGATKAAIDAIKSGQDFLRDIGADLTRYVSAVSVGTRDPGEYGLSGEAGTPRTGGAPGDIEGLVNTALKDVLSYANFADPVIDAVADALAGTGRSFDDIAETLAKLKNILGDTGPELSKWGQALKEIHDTIDPLIEELGSAAGALEDALERAITALRDKFADDIERQILAIEAPLALDFRDLIEAQATRISDAQALGADPALMADVTKLNRLEFERFLETAKQNVGQLKNVREQIEALIDEASRLGQPLSEIVATMQAALDGIVNTFNQDITRQLATLTNPTKAALIDLLEQQRERTRQAVELGANVVAVERLNALERQKFFENLSEEQKLQLGDVLGLIEDYGGQIGVVLAQVNDAFTAQIDKMEETRAAVEKMRDTWKNFADAVKSTREGIVDRYGPGSPLAKLDDLRARFATLRTDALAGNESAQAALPQVAQQIIDRSRELFGTTQSFFADYNTITQALAEIEAAATGRVNEAQQEIDRLTAQVDLLTEIRNVLQQPDPSLDFLEQQIGQIDQTNVLLRELLTTYVDLTRQQLAQNTGLVQGLAGANLSGLLGPAPTGTGSSINLAQLIAQQAGQQAAQAVNQVLTQPGAIGNPTPGTGGGTQSPGGSVGGSPTGGVRQNANGGHGAGVGAAIDCGLAFRRAKRPCRTNRARL